MTKRKYLVFVLVTTLLTSLLTGCGKVEQTEASIASAEESTESSQAVEPISEDYYARMLYMSRFEMDGGILTVSVDSGELWSSNEVYQMH